MKLRVITLLLLSFFALSVQAMCTWQGMYCADPKYDGCYFGAASCVGHACMIDKTGQIAVYDRGQTLRATEPRDYTQIDTDQCTEMMDSKHM